MIELIDSLREKAKKFHSILSDKEKELIYFNSIQNFLLYIDKFPTESEKKEVIVKIEYYFIQIETDKFSFHISEKKEILRSIINPIAFFYIARFNFKYHGTLKTILFIGVNIDIFLLFIGVLQACYYIPIATVAIYLYWLYVEIFYARKNLVY